MLPRNHPDRIQIAFDDPRLVANAGLLLPVTLAQHLGLREVVDSHVDLGDAPGRANPGDKLLTLVASALAGGDFIDDADVLRTGGTASAIGCVVKAPSTLGTFPAQLPVGPCPPAGSGEPGVAGPGLGRWCGTRRRAVDHRPGLHHLRDLRTGQGGRASPWLHRPAGLSPAAGRRRRHRRRADVPAARGPGQHRSGRRPLPAGDRGTGAPCWGQGTTHGAGRQRLLCPRHGRPSAARWMSASPSPSASTPACAISSRPYPRRTGRPSPTGWTAPPTWPRPPTLPSRVSPTPRRCGSSSGG